MRAEVIEQILVKVNGEIFTKTDLETRQVAALRQMGQQVDPKTDPSDAQLRKMLERGHAGAHGQRRGRDAHGAARPELGYKLGDEQFQSVLENIKKDNKIESDEQFQAALKQENMTLADLRRNLERQMIIRSVQQNEVLGRIAVSEEEARRVLRRASERVHDAADDHAARDFRRRARRRHDDQRGRRRRGAGEGRRRSAQRALAGESFEKLAADLSDSPSRANAGLIGPLNVDDLVAGPQEADRDDEGGRHQRGAARRRRATRS